ncbi:lipoprotein receptor-related protein 5 [Mactra antiquata]
MCVVLTNGQPFEGFVLLPSLPDAAVLALLRSYTFTHLFTIGLVAACENQFICEIDPTIGTGCINKTYICDGIPDCSDGTDEDNCPFKCDDGQYQCQGPVQRCISASQFCDGVGNCPNNDDESDCKSTCPSNMLTCTNGNCVPANKICDGSMDCPDNADENECAQLGCPGNQFRCSDGNCVNASQLCDATNNCINNEDEAFCPARGCSPNQFA